MDNGPSSQEDKKTVPATNPSSTGHEEAQAQRCPIGEHSTYDEFYQYYAEESLRPEAIARFRSIQGLIMRVRHNEGLDARSLDVADIGCGAGTQALLWAVGGHRVCGLDISEQLVELARKRASESVLAADFRLGSALRLPWPDESMDICLVIELLEHVSQWQVCLRECARVLRPMGILFLTTTNALCPFQEEFNLPLYGWYPRSVKRYFERLAKTKRPDLANYATYPAINWLNFYSIRSFLQPVGLHCLDRFDLIDAENKTRVARFVISCIRSIPPLRFMAHLTSHSTTLLAIKSKEPGSYGTSGISLFRNRILG